MRNFRNIGLIVEISQLHITQNIDFMASIDVTRKICSTAKICLLHIDHSTEISAYIAENKFPIPYK